MKCVCVVAALLCLRLAGSEDLYWKPNTDWSTPSNWALGRAPCEGDVADLSSIPRGSVVKLDASTTVRSVLLPVGSTLALGRAVSLRLSNKTTCTVETSTGPMVAEIKEENSFVGAGPKYWECPGNWEYSNTQDTPKTAPCRQDRAIFRKGHYYSSVQSKVPVTVQYLKVRGELVTTELISTVAPDFKLDLKVVPHCGEDPAQCPCLATSSCPTGNPGSVKGGSSDSGRIAGIVVVVLVVIVVGVLVGVLVVLWVRWRHRTQRNPYKREDLVGEPEDSREGAARAGHRDEVLFDNPIYEMGLVGSDGKKPSGEGDGASESEATKTREREAIAILSPSTEAEAYEPVGYTAARDAPVVEAGQPDDDYDGKKVPVLDEYERLP